MNDPIQVAEVLSHAAIDGRTVTVTLDDGSGASGTVSDHPTNPDVFRVTDPDGKHLHFYPDEVAEIVNEA